MIMKLFAHEQMKKWDEFTCSQSGIRSWQLMERAAIACKDWLLNAGMAKQPIHIFCGKGNNGGDGLALARLLHDEKTTVTVHILETGKPGTPDFQENLQKIHTTDLPVHYLQQPEHFPVIKPTDLIIDALAGIGFSGNPRGLFCDLITYLNNADCPIVSIDQPSGLNAERITEMGTCIEANDTLTFERPKLAFMFAANERFTGNIHIIPIGLSKEFDLHEPSAYEIPDEILVRSIYRPRGKFTHKGNYGHACLVAGSTGMMGAAVLASMSVGRAGAGKLSCYTVPEGFPALHTAVPEAMTGTLEELLLIMRSGEKPHSAIAAGPGIGTTEGITKWFTTLLKVAEQPMILDADALNIIAAHPEWMDKLPKGSLLTPHPKEFDQLFGKSADETERLYKAMTFASALKVHIILKGHHTAIITPGGQVYFNNTGNAGMAKAGMGDVLTGLLLGLMAQGYLLPEAAILGVYLHGLAGDIAALEYSMEAMQASDVTNMLGEAWKKISSEVSG
jgi:NAD(P)H-hydrate epimerase